MSRNPEMKKQIIIFTTLTIIFVVLSLLHSSILAFFIFLGCCSFSGVSLLMCEKRYQQIAQLNEKIESILNGNDTLPINNYVEGEIGILQNDIYKLTIRLKEQAVALQSDKKYLSDSLADISHQIRTPLTSINIILSRLSGSDLTNEQKYALTNELHNLISHIDWLINTLLKISKLDAGTIAFSHNPICVRELINKSVCEIAIPMDIKNQTFKVKLDGEPFFNGDISWSVEALTNIMKNCMEHTPNGGEICINSSENAIYTLIEIIDNGSGIDPNDIHNIFKRFYKGKNSSNSSVGIGLSLSQKIILKQNGTIMVQNNKDCGSKFTIKLYKSVL